MNCRGGWSILLTLRYRLGEGIFSLGSPSCTTILAGKMDIHNIRTSWPQWAGEVKGALLDREWDPCHYAISVDADSRIIEYSPPKTKIFESILNGPSVTEGLYGIINEIGQSCTCVSDWYCSTRHFYLCSWSGPPLSIRLAGVSSSNLKENPDLVSLVWVSSKNLLIGPPAAVEIPCEEAPETSAEATTNR